jgi:hypothetical protein
MTKPSPGQGTGEAAIDGKPAAASSGAAGKRKKKDKATSLLSFGDELEDGGDGGAENFGSISQSTQKRFLAEERKRRRQEEEAASSAVNSVTPLTSPPTPSHQDAGQAHATASTPSVSAVSATPRRQQCVVDDDQSVWLPLGVVWHVCVQRLLCFSGAGFCFPTK